MPAAATHFSADYFEARAKFLAAAKKRGARIQSHLNPHARGAEGQDLFIDVATLGQDNAPNGLLLISATHGVEGFAGSGSQIAFLEDELSGQLPPGLKITLLHALNPYGFAWLRRVNEDNADLNRNCVDHSKPQHRNAGYAELYSAINPVNWMDQEAVKTANTQLREYARKHGAFALQEAATAGQYDHPDGIYYGGSREAWSIGILRHTVLREFAKAKRFVFLDFHTGLGDLGDIEIISESAPNDPSYIRAKAWWGDRVKTTVSGESLSAQLSGTLDSFLPGLLPKAETTGVALEYGTYSLEECFHALRGDNWLHIHGDPRGQGAAAIQAEIRRAFYPDTEAWKDRVWSQAREVIAKTLQVLSPCLEPSV
jgi:hypothetical protein